MDPVNQKPRASGRRGSGVWHRFLRGLLRRGPDLQVARAGATGVATPPDPRDLRDPQACLLAAQHFLAQAFEGCWQRMSRRDQQLYRQMIRTTSLQTLVALRFENFDLMCRLLGEGVARAHQRRIDAWLPVRR